MKIASQIEKAAAEACQTLFDFTPSENQIQVQLTKKDFDGQITLVVFPFVKQAKMAPEACGNKLGEFLQTHVEEVVGFNTVKGFLNLSIADHYWTSRIGEVVQNENYGQGTPDSKPLVLVEYASPNTNKPLHLGHLRNIFLGDSVAEMLKAIGHRVKSVQIINDRGIHICKSMVAWQRFSDGETPESSGMKGDKLVGKYYVEFDKHYKAQIAELVEKGTSKEEAEKEAPILKEAQQMLQRWEREDPEVVALWEKMNGWVYAGFDVTYEKMGVAFDQLYYESETYLYGKKEVERGLNKGIFEKRDDGSVWVDLTEEKLDPKLLIRSDGTTVYMTQDVGTAIQRNNDFPEMTHMIYTVGNEQEHHFKVLFAILKKLGYAWADNCYHLSYGMVELPEGKMKSREGTVVDADDMIDEMVESARQIAEELGKLEELSDSEKEDLFRQIGLAALKYFLLKVDAKKNMLFDPKESIDFNGNTGPFIQYAHARIQSLLRKAGEVGAFDASNVNLSEPEMELAVKIDRYPDVLEEAALHHSPAELANFLYDLVKDYNHFYQSVPVLKEENSDQMHFLLQLSQATARIIRSGLKLLGIESPERM